MNREANFSYNLVKVIDSGLAVFTGKNAILASRNIKHDFVIFWRNGLWSYIGMPNVVTALCWLAEKQILIVICGDGVARLLDQNGEQVEVIDPSPDGPSSLQWLLSGTVVQGIPYVCGMKRQVYRRLGPGAWERIDASLRTDETTGLTAIAGHSEHEIVAVGFGGEIWSYNGAAWVGEASPTNVKLRCIVPLTDRHEFLLAGGQGVIIVGAPGRWASVTQDLTRSTFWSATLFAGHIVLGSDAGLFSIDLRDLYNSFAVFNIDSAGLAYVDAADGVLWAAGSNRLVRSNGAQWDDVPGPEAP